jgi:hypothetical protein
MTALRLATNGCDADAKLKKWGEAVKTTFDADNLHLTSCASAGGHEQIVNCVQQLGRTLGEVQVKLGASTATVKATVVEMQSKIEALGAQLNSFGAALATRGLASSPSKSPAKKARAANDADALGAPAPPRAAPSLAGEADALGADAARAGAGAVSLAGVAPSAGARRSRARRQRSSTSRARPAVPRCWTLRA